MAKISTSPPSASPAPAPSRRGVFARRQVPPRIKAAVLALCALVLVVAGYWGIYPQAVAYTRWHQAQTALRELDFDAARRDLESCAAVWSNSAETQFLLARTCRRQGDLEAANAHLREAKRLHWVDEQITLESTLLRVSAGVIKPNESILRGYLDRGDPDSRLILEALVVGSLQTNFLSEAYHWSEAWCKNFPDDWEGHYWQGNVLLAGSNLEKAGVQFERALAGNPGFWRAQIQLGEVLRRRGRYAEAVQHFQAALDRQPSDGAALLGLARCDRALNSPDGTRAALDRLLAAYPHDANGLRLRGQLALDNDNPQEALDWLQKADAANPDNKDTLKALADTCRLLNRTAERQKYEARWKEVDTAIRRLDKIATEVATNSQDVGLRFEAATILVRLGRRREALPWLTSILQIDPKHDEARKLLEKLIHDINDPALTTALARLRKP